MNLNDLKEIDQTRTDMPVPLTSPQPPRNTLLGRVRQCLKAVFAILSAALYIAVLAVFPLFLACAALIGEMRRIFRNRTQHKDK